MGVEAFFRSEALPTEVSETRHSCELEGCINIGILQQKSDL
jgi:hypothetical protein